MLDIETVGKVPGCAILSVGAVVFHWDTPRVGATFYMAATISSNAAAGLTFDKDTALWWNEQSKDAREAVFAGTHSLADVLAGLANFFPAGSVVWARDPDFDCSILAHAYKSVLGTEAPWAYNRKRAMRTLVELAEHTGRSIPWPAFPDGAIQHHALHDALHQVKVARMAYHTLMAHARRHDDAAPVLPTKGRGFFGDQP
jgi:hypothetical protein